MGPQEFAPDMLALANGNLVVAGVVSNERVAIAELLPDGRLDPGFGEHGVEITAIKLLPWQILALPDGELLVLGPNRSPSEQEPVITSYPDWQMLRLRSDGTPDATFGTKAACWMSPAHRCRARRAARAGAPAGAEWRHRPAHVHRPVFSQARTTFLVRLADGTRDASFGGLVSFSSAATLAASRCVPMGPSWW